MTGSRSLRRSSRRSAAHLASTGSATTAEPLKADVVLPPKPPISVSPALESREDKRKKLLEKQVSFSPPVPQDATAMPSIVAPGEAVTAVEHSVEASLAECGHDLSFTEPDAERDLKCALCWKTREMFVDNLLGPLMGLFDIGEETVDEKVDEKGVVGKQEVKETGRLTELRIAGEKESCPSLPKSRVPNNHQETSESRHQFREDDTQPSLPSLAHSATTTSKKPVSTPASPHNSRRPASPALSSSPPLSSPPPTPPPTAKRTYSSTDYDSDSEDTTSTGSIIHVALPASVIPRRARSPAAKRTRLNQYPRNSARPTAPPPLEPKSPATPTVPFVSKSGVKTLGKTPGRYLGFGRPKGSPTPNPGTLDEFIASPFNSLSKSNSTTSTSTTPVSGRKMPISGGKKTQQLGAGQSKIMSFFKPLSEGTIAARVIPVSSLSGKKPVKDIEIPKQGEREEQSRAEGLPDYSSRIRRRQPAPVLRKDTEIHEGEQKINRVSLAAKKRKRGPNGTFLPKSALVNDAEGEH